MKSIPSSVRLLQLASIVLIFHVGNSLLQEQVFHLPGFNHALLLSFLQTVCVAAFALIDYVRKTGFNGRKTPIKYYIVISLLAVVASVATNEASLRLNYPTQVIFKSSKLLAVMFVRSIMMKQHKLTSMDIGSALTVIAGLAAFTYGTHQSKLMMKASSSISTAAAAVPMTTTTTTSGDMMIGSIDHHHISSFMIGVIAVLIAVGADAMLYIVEEKYCFHTFGSSNGEIIVFLNGFAALHAGAALTVSGKLGESLSYLAATESLLPLVVAFSLCNFVGTTAILSVVSEFGSPSAIIVTNTRKVCTILGSYLVYPKPFTFLHGVGLVLVTGGVYAHEMARKKKKAHGENEITTTVGNDYDEDNNNTGDKQKSFGDEGSSPMMLIIPPTTPA